MATSELFNRADGQIGADWSAAGGYDGSTLYVKSNALGLNATGEQSVYNNTWSAAGDDWWIKWTDTVQCADRHIGIGMGTNTGTGQTYVQRYVSQGNLVRFYINGSYEANYVLETLGTWLIQKTGTNLKAYKNTGSGFTEVFNSSTGGVSLVRPIIFAQTSADTTGRLDDIYWGDGTAPDLSTQSVIPHMTNYYF